MRRALAVPEHLELLGAIALGWPLDDGAAPAGASGPAPAPADRRDHPPRRVVRAASRWRDGSGRSATVLGSVGPHFRGLSHPGTVLDAEAIVEAAQRSRRPPVGLAGELHERRHQRARMMVASISTASARPMPNSLMKRDARRGEGEERDRQEQRGGGDDAAGALQAEGDRVVVVAGAVVLLLDPREQEHLVVHRQPEGDAEHEDRHRRVDGAGGGEAEQSPRWPSWKIHTIAPNVAVRLSTLSTIALIGTSTLPTSRNSSTNVATAMIARSRAAGVRTIDALVSTSSAAGPPTNDVAVVGVEAANVAHETLAVARRHGERRAPPTSSRSPLGA